MMKFKLGETEMTEGGMPIAPVYVVDENGAVQCGGEEVGWLAPFRGYKFQVSGSKEGSGDMGSSQVVGLKNLDALDTRMAAPNNRSIYSSNLRWGLPDEGSDEDSTVKTYVYFLMALHAVVNLTGTRGIPDGVELGRLVMLSKDNFQYDLWKFAGLCRKWMDGMK
jgi:hypothetical protein